MQTVKNEKGLWAMTESCFFPLVFYYFVNNAVVILAGIGVQRLGAEGTGWETYLLAGGRMLGMFLGAMAVYPCYKREQEKREGNAEKKISLGEGLVIVLTGILFALGVNFLFAAVGLTESSESYRQVAEVQFSLPLWLALPFYTILSPMAEELVFRGILYQAWKRFLPKNAALLGSAVLFGAFHGNIVQMLYGTIMGIVMALFYEKYHKLWAPVLFHEAANGAVCIWTYFF